MPALLSDSSLLFRDRSWKWRICGLLLLATMVNYMDRLTLNQMAKPIMTEFGMTAREYGQLESAFGVAFALGAILMGWMADRWNVRGVYAAAVLLWSLAGFLTGLAQGFATLLLCRFLLGLAESGNWPCALRTTQRILPASERPMGNGLLQSGAAIGAILTPLVVLFLFREQEPNSWRYPFLAIGMVGLLWVAGWLFSVRREDLARTEISRSPSLISILGFLVGLYSLDLLVHIVYADRPWVPLAVKLGVTALGVGGVAYWLARATREDPKLERAVFFRRFWVLAFLVVTINITWHFFRAWLPLFLQNQHGYTLQQFGWFSMAYYLATDAGCLTAGFVTLQLARGGVPVHTSRLLVFSACAVITTLSVVAAVLPASWPLLGVLLVIGFASLGLFPNYYSFTQELSERHQGKVTGSLGCICWMFMSLLHEVVGDMVKRTGTYSLGVGCAGLVPLLGVAVVIVFWGKTPARSIAVLIDEPAPRPHTEGIQQEPSAATMTATISCFPGDSRAESRS
ncbi:MAG TPA: MFS transporter [Gemmataceae bacterium]|nr:MFS transporter [Gemmataceae bacterium]